MKNFMKQFLRAVLALILIVLNIPVFLVTLIIANIWLLFTPKELPIKARYMAFYSGVAAGLRIIPNFIKYGANDAFQLIALDEEEMTEQAIEFLHSLTEEDTIET